MTDDLGAIRCQVWQLLQEGASDRTSAARHIVLATVGRTGGAEARTVILRRAQQRIAALEFHTDRASEKVAEIEIHPYGTVLLWEPETALQVRLRVMLSVRKGTEAEWGRIPAPSRFAYGGQPPSGQRIVNPGAVSLLQEPERFAVIEARIEEIETLHLATQPHRRALFRRADDFTGAWLAP
ncbi:pyridoxamine 5'-phosphate oxidase family protein [Ovoidimarina sediminis]|uniref:pyridoxamine 5'-phosphate oxidase family protein n=1 Tax=Ovoidimarina sediminis TaxID=3079856 RepID=UPI0029113FF9|nr:pyridoxamine 5'-phosphate oxidase family protein [Rhodophyticola sp. MJ-SS7]MDU8945223.1 pyridoxamine 5'-phosphate oxidase family protein [Rhodophyticola sp. MJ-SS7]